MNRLFKVSSHQAGMTLLSFLRTQFLNECSVKALKKAVERKNCKINGKIETFSTHLLTNGSVVEIDVTSLGASKSFSMPEILYEDPYFLACDKVPGLVSEDVCGLLKRTSSTHKNAPLSLIHRLDKETSGVILVSKSENFREEMVKLFSMKCVDKKYVALVDGQLLKQEGKISNFLHPKHSYQGQVLYGSSFKGKEAVTIWKLLKQGPKASLVECTPLTGRTHQLRVHLKEMGHPILGDFQYSSHFKSALNPKRHMLHAAHIAFSHPITGEKVAIDSKLPEDFIEAAKALGLLL